MTEHIVAGKYKLLRRLGKGGMAEVFLAKQVGLDGFEKLVVVKRILPHLAALDDFVRMFMDEARTAADLRHPNVVNIFDIGEDAGTYYMAMEFLHGHDIRAIQRHSVKMNRPIPLGATLQIVLDAANGLYHAHTKADLSGAPLHIIHRDISPQNIITTYDGATKIVDFGIAKATTQTTETQSGVVKGKYTYMSPEQVGGKKLDHRTDQFALGIVTWELLTMRRLFKRENEMKTLAAITECSVPPPSRYADVPKSLDRIVQKALHKDRQRRFKNCQEFMVAIEDFLMEERVAHSPSRLGNFLTALFAEELKEEEARGVGYSDQESLASVKIDATQAARRRPRPTESLRAVSESDGIQVGAPDDLTVVSGPRPQTSRRGLMLTAILLLVGAGVAAAFWFIPSGQDAAEVAREVVIRSTPRGATLIVDGQKSDETTPVVLRDVAAATPHKLVLSLEGYKTQELTRTFSGGNEQVGVDVEMVPLAEASPAVEVSPKPDRTERPKKPRRPSRTRKAEEGKLSISVKPWAKVYVDGKYYDTTPFPAFEIPAGKHRLKFVNTDLKKSQTKNVVVKSGKTATVRIQF